MVFLLVSMVFLLVSMVFLDVLGIHYPCPLAEAQSNRARVHVEPGPENRPGRSPGRPVASAAPACSRSGGDTETVYEP